MADPLGMLQAALGSAPNSKSQADHLSNLRDNLERNSAPIKVLTPLLVAKTLSGSEWVLRAWVLELFLFALAKSSLSPDDKVFLASQILDNMAVLLGDTDTSTVKLVIQILTAVYPILFRHLCTVRTNPNQWQTLSSCKARILEIFYAPQAPAGLKISAVKFAQRVLLVQTRGVTDPRLQNKSDPSLSMVPGDHPFINAHQLEQEGSKILEGLITILYISAHVDLLSALVNSWVNLTKLRPGMTPFVVDSLRHWQPTALANSSYSEVRSTEKAIRIVLVHLSRLPSNIALVPQINEALAQQAARMDHAAEMEKRRRAEGRKRPLSSSEISGEGSAAKRAKLEDVSSSPDPAGVLASFDFTTLPAPLVTELIIANLHHFSQAELDGLVERYRQQRGLSNGQPAPGLANQFKQPTQRTPTPTAPPPAPVKPRNIEPQDPLKMDIDDQEDLEFEPDRLNDELSDPTDDSEARLLAEAALRAPALTLSQLQDFKLPPPAPLNSEDERISLVEEAVLKRVSSTGKDVQALTSPVENLGETAAGSQPEEMWVLLVLRVITRVVDPSAEQTEGQGDVKMEDGDDAGQVTLQSRQDKLREKLCDWIAGDFVGRIRLATAWMNEEWYNDQLRLRQHIPWRANYETWLSNLISSYASSSGGSIKDKVFSKFLLDLPSIPGEVFELLRDCCVDFESPERMQIGFVALRGFVSQRLALRADAINVLLELTTHPERKVRNAAINTVKTWVPNHPPLSNLIKAFATQLLRKLQFGSPATLKTEEAKEKLEKGDANGTQDAVNTEEADLHEVKRSLSEEPVKKDLDNDDENMEDGQITPEELVQTPYLPERIELPADKASVLQHVELLFALCVKAPDLLDEIFASYGTMDITVQTAIQELITALVRSLGPSHGKLLTLLRTFRPGAESLALRIINIFTDGGRPSAQMVALVKVLVSEKNLDARFLIPIVGEMDKADIVRHLPKIVSILNGQPEPKNLVKSVFNSIVTAPPQTFGVISSNLPRVRQSESLTPVELMVLLHDAEKEIGLKSAIEAIGVCFSMSDVYRSEILAVVMQQIVDQPVLPVLFMRTVIQAVTTYKSLIGFVSTTLFSRLITKKIWTNPLLWEGFIRCAKLIAPASFGALLQLPKDQLKELVEKQPTLKAGLRDFVHKKQPASNKARVAGFLDIFGEPGDTPTSSAPGTPIPTVEMEDVSPEQEGTPPPPQSLPISPDVPS